MLNNKNVFVYWVGKSFSLVELLHKIMALHSNNGQHYQLHLLNETNLTHYLQEIPNNFYQLNPAYQADYVRVAVIERYGGIWLDSDTLVMSDLSELFNLFETRQGFFIRQNNEILCNGVFGSKAGTPLMVQWRNDILQLINEKASTLEWSELGNLWLENTANTTHLFENYQIYEGLDSMYPVNWDQCVDAFLQQPYLHYKKLIRPFQPLLVLVNSVYRKIENHSVPDILAADYPLNYFIKQSLNQALLNNK